MPLNQARHGAGTIAIDISAVASQPGSVLGVTEISRLALSEELPLKKTKADRPKKPVSHVGAKTINLHKKRLTCLASLSIQTECICPFHSDGFLELTSRCRSIGCERAIKDKQTGEH
jgi:hypothetical protein